MYVVMGELTCRKEDGEDDAEGVTKGYHILCLNMISFRFLSQLLYYDLLDTVNYSALKQKLILFLII